MTRSNQPSRNGSLSATPLPNADLGREAPRVRPPPSRRSSRCPTPSLAPSPLSAAASLPGATSDVEDTSASQIAQLDEVLEGSPPARVRRAKGVVGPRAGVEVRAPLRAHVSRNRRSARRAAAPRAALDERRLAALGERDLDDVEVARNNGVREQLPRLVSDLPAEVAARDVREREHLDAGLSRDERGLPRRGVARLSRTLELVRAEASPRARAGRRPRPPRRPSRHGAVSPVSATERAGRSTPST